jgi:hypothetical protein
MKNILEYWRSAGVSGIALLLTAGLCATELGDAQAEAAGHIFTPVAFLGDPAPGGHTFVNDFEPGGLNSRGDMAFGADIGTVRKTLGEGVFLKRNGQITELGRTGGDAPGGGTFAANFLGPVSLNNWGDMVLYRTRFFGHKATLSGLSHSRR